MYSYFQNNGNDMRKFANVSNRLQHGISMSMQTLQYSREMMIILTEQDSIEWHVMKTRATG